MGALNTGADACRAFSDAARRAIDKRHRREGEPVTAKSLEAAFYRCYWKRYDIILPNTFLIPWQCEIDLLCIRKSLLVDEIETKVTRTDFLADFSKTVVFPDEGWKKVNKHEAAAAGKLYFNRHWFLIPDELREKVDVPEHSGLMVLQNGFIRELRPAPMLHKRKATPDMIFRAGAATSRRLWSLKKKELMTHDNV
jgi:hypothetical protein